MRFRSTSRAADSRDRGHLRHRHPPLPRQEGEPEGEDEEETTLIKTVGWISAGLGAVALGLFIGRELRQRYQFNRRTPYDFYAHSGDEQDVDFGLGI